MKEGRMRTVTTLLDVLGVGLLVVGAALVWLPAALFVGGAAALVLSWRLSGGVS